MQNKRSKYIFAFLLACLFSILLLFYYKVFTLKSAKAIYGALANVFFVPGMVLFCLGLLIFSTNEGVFRMIAFGVKKAIKIIFTSKKDEKDYYQYNLEKSEEKAPWFHFTFVGIIFIIVSIIFSVLYINN